MALNLRKALQIRYNRRVHDDQARQYQATHVEIYNPTEQSRIRTMIERVSAMARRDGGELEALDFGCGTGNLTQHLLDIGARVVAADVSEDSLRALETRFARAETLSTAKLNGEDLAEFRDAQFDLVATYSVLHHVPDYLRIVREFARVVRPGGLIVIDHECCPSYWQQSEPYRQYASAYRDRYSPTRAQLWSSRLAKSTSLTHWKRFLTRKFLGINAEGDIHVFPHDHIRWDLIREALGSCDIVSETDYLVCRETETPPTLYERYRYQCSDMRVGIYRRR